MEIAIVIPAYQPGQALVETVRGLVGRGECPGEIVIVDDGSGPECRDLFEECRQYAHVHLVRHAVNLGKGAALKTGINYALCLAPGLTGVVTADADGQHMPEDIIAVAAALKQRPHCMVLGARTFGREAPARSRIGNLLTRQAMRVLVGGKVTDTQTGLRGIPRSLLPDLLRIPSMGYEFELDMLIAAKHRGCRVEECRIATIYRDGNRSSHFNPFFDSVRIYFVLLRFSFVSLMTAGLDNAIFLIVFNWTGNVAGAQTSARAIAALFNYTAARRAVFLSRERHAVVFPRYLFLVTASGAVSYLLIRALAEILSMKVLWAKVAAESILFIVNFALQRDFVFAKRAESQDATDWDRYYRSVPITALLVRHYTSRVLLSCLTRIAGLRNGCAIAEFGGGNSCFLHAIRRAVQPGQYCVVDNNRYGLELLRERTAGAPDILLHCENVLSMTARLQADAAFSVGLIEHFDEESTAQAIRAHLDAVRPGGHVILSYPTPTWLYRASRFVLEVAGLWRFPDERPLKFSEVAASVADAGEVLFRKTLWPLVLTQELIVVRKRAAGTPAAASNAVSGV